MNSWMLHVLLQIQSVQFNVWYVRTEYYVLQSDDSHSWRIKEDGEVYRL